MKRVVIVGSGITGLTTALALKDRASEIPEGLEIVVLEAGDRVGGNIATDRVDGFTVEMGPNGYLDNVPETLALISRLGLDEEVQQADEAAEKRFLFRNGKLHFLPADPIGFLRCGVLSVRGRIRVMFEPFARSRPEGVDETVFDFAARRIGPEAASVLVDAMVSGVFAGNVNELSLQSTFPKMAAMEADHGGLVKAMVAKMVARRRAKKRGETIVAGGPAGPAGRLTSFRNGLDTLPMRLAEELGNTVQLNEAVVGLKRKHTTGWTVTTGKGATLDADAVVLTQPSPMTAPLLESAQSDLAAAVARIPAAGLAVVALAYRLEDIGGAPDGFGFLVPRSEGTRILGCLWDSSIFPGRAPADMALMRVMIGGANDAEAVALGEDELLDIVRREIAETMGLTADPYWTRIYRYPLGIGQYLVGHQDLLDHIHGHLEDLGGLWLAGSSYYGVSMNACIEKAGEQAGEILDHLNARSDSPDC